MTRRKGRKLRRKIITAILIVFFAIALILYLNINNKYTNKNILKEEKTLIAKQTKLEEGFKIKGYTLETPNIILNPYDNSPLTALVLFETNKEVQVKVTVHGKDKLSTISHTETNKTKEHYIEVLGLYPDKLNKVTIEYQDDEGIHKKDLEIKTEKLPDDFVIATSVKADKTKLDESFYFFSPASRGYTSAYDVNGDVRWYLSNNAVWRVKRLANGHLMTSTERLINFPYYMTGLYEMDMLGKIYNEYTIPGGYHHDYYEMENGNILVASDDFNNEDGTVEDYIVEIDRKNGNIVKSFDLKDILNMEDGQSENWTAYDWFHNNSVWYDKKTNSITLSGRHQDAVINIDYKSGKLNWIIGDSANWSKEYQKYFFKPIGNNFEWQWSQHAAMVTPEGYIFILDNGNNKSKDKKKYVAAENSYTRGVMYKINTNNMTIEQIWQYGKERGSSFYSPYISDVDYLKENHYIVHSGGIVSVNGKPSNQPAGLTTGDTKLKSDTVELLNNKVIYELVLPTNYYRVEKMKIYQDNDFYLGEAKRLGELNKTEVTKTKILGLNKAQKIDEEYKTHNVKFTKEEDRLVLTGRFQVKTNVKVILYKNLISKVYDFRVNRRPYTALCIDVFSEDENENGLVISRYVNSKGLKGKYSIYLDINGKLYNTEEVVEF